MPENASIKIIREVDLQNPSLVVGWADDAGDLGAKTIDYLSTKLVVEEFGEIEPVDFFPLGGVSVRDDVARFPGSRFVCCREHNLVMLKSDLPRSEWYRFLASVLDIAEHYCHAKEIYTIGGIVSQGAHTTPRNVIGIANSPELKDVLRQYGLAVDTDYQTPPDQRPTLSSFLLWLAKGRNIPGASLWTAVPSYLVTIEDAKACRKTLEFLDHRINLRLDFRDLDEEVTNQNEQLAQMRLLMPEVDKYIRRLETNLALAEEESETLIRETEAYFRKGR